MINANLKISVMGVGATLTWVSYRSLSDTVMGKLRNQKHNTGIRFSWCQGPEVGMNILF